VHRKSTHTAKHSPLQSDRAGPRVVASVALVRGQGRASGVTARPAAMWGVGAAGAWGCCPSRVVTVKVELLTSVSYSLGSPNRLIYPQRRSFGCSDPAHAPPRPKSLGRATNVHPQVSRPPRPARRWSSRSSLTVSQRCTLGTSWRLPLRLPTYTGTGTAARPPLPT